MLGERTTEVKLPGEGAPASRPADAGRSRHRPSANLFRLSALPQRDRGRARTTRPAAATRSPLPPRLNGVIVTAGDVDRYVFRAAKGPGGKLDVRVYARQVRSPLDSVLSIAARDGGRVGSNDDSGGPDGFLRFTAPKDGEYVVTISDQLRKGGAGLHLPGSR
ncbi:MAG: PPC domain-containing protein [Isosphaeraceae bacterium]